MKHIAEVASATALGLSLIGLYLAEQRRRGAATDENDDEEPRSPAMSKDDKRKARFDALVLERGQAGTKDYRVHVLETTSSQASEVCLWRGPASIRRRIFFGPGAAATNLMTPCGAAAAATRLVRGISDARPPPRAPRGRSRGSSAAAAGRLVRGISDARPPPRAPRGSSAGSPRRRDHKKSSC